MKSWAYLCRESQSQSPTYCLPPEFCPFLDREVVKDPNELGAKYASDWLKHGGPNNRSLMIWDLQAPEEATRGLFQVSRSAIEKIKQFVVSKKKEKNNTKLHLSTFVLSLAYALVCRVKAEEVKSKRVVLGVNVDCRRWLEPPLPPTYFGNCVGGKAVTVETRELLGEEGVIVAVEALSEALETLNEDGVLNGAENWSSMLFDGLVTADDKIIGAAGSPRFEVYRSDFGWGRPKKVEMVSIDRTAAFSLSDSKNGDGVEVGFVSKKKTMETFASLFAKGLHSS